MKEVRISNNYNGGSETFDESQTLAAGQVIVEFASIKVSKAAIYTVGLDADQGRLALGVDYNVVDSATIELVESYPANTQIYGIVNDPIAASALYDEIGDYTNLLFYTTDDLLNRKVVGGVTANLAIDNILQVLETTTTYQVGDTDEGQGLDLGDGLWANPIGSLSTPEFVQLPDTPSSYAGFAKGIAVVNDTESGLDFSNDIVDDTPF